MSPHGTGSQGDGALDTWRSACQRVLSESGRARLHDVRAALNSVAVSAEVLHMASASPDALPGSVAGQMLQTIRHDLATAAAELLALEALLTQTAAPAPGRWPQAVEWAFAMTEPVARRRQIVLVPPSSVPPVEADTRAGLCLALALVEASADAAAGSRCVMRALPEPPSLTLEWIAPRGSTSDTLAPRLFAWVFGPRARWSHEGDHCRLDLTIGAQF
jgi:hypothetical protein